MVRPVVEIIIIIPNNPNPVGITKWVMTSTDGLMLDFDIIYQGEKSLELQRLPDKPLGLDALVVAR